MFNCTTYLLLDNDKRHSKRSISTAIIQTPLTTGNHTAQADTHLYKCHSEDTAWACSVHSSNYRYEVISLRTSKCPQKGMWVLIPLVFPDSNDHTVTHMLKVYSHMLYRVYMIRFRSFMIRPSCDTKLTCQVAPKPASNCLTSDYKQNKNNYCIF